MTDRHEEPRSAKGHHWFFATLLIMVILAVTAGLALSRHRTTGADEGPAIIKSHSAGLA